MPKDTWAEYLEAASAHLHASRRAVEQGAVTPDPPDHPAGPPPDGFEPRLRRLAVAYDQLTTEVVTRMADLGWRPMPPRAELPSPAYYIDQRA